MSRATVCSHCKAKLPHADLARWTVSLCANGGRKRVFYLCNPCDVAINRHMLIVMGDTKVNMKMARYVLGRV